MTGANFFKSILFMALAGFSLGAAAQIRYEAPIDPAAQKLWTSKQSKLSCMLQCDIPDYGYVAFTTYAGREHKTFMRITPKLGITDNSEMRFIAVRPEWRAGGREELLGRIQLYQGFLPYAGPTLTWKVLESLNAGLQVYFPYTDEHLAAGQNIIPILSPLGFKPQFRKYINCQQQLLPVSYEDVQLLPLVFNFQAATLTGRSQERLMQQIEYIKEDDAINHIVIAAFAYDMKLKADNISLAQDRAEVLKKYYTDAGFEERMIEVQPFDVMTLPNDSDSRPVNEEPSARNALVTLKRDSAKFNREIETQTPDVGADTGEVR